MATIYRTLLLCKKQASNNFTLIYGHSIYWKLTELDYRVNNWKEINIKGDFYVFYCDLENEELINELLDEEKIVLASNEKSRTINFGWEDCENMFITQNSEEEEYNPFITHCTHSKFYFSEVCSHNLEEFLSENSELFIRFNNKYFIPLVENPHLLYTFAKYNPVRIEVLAKKKLDENNNYIGCEVLVNDVFSEFQDSEVSLELRTQEKSLIKSYKVKDLPDFIPITFNPDYMEVVIRNGKDDIYSQTAYFIKSVSIEMKVSDNKIVTPSGTVPTYSKRSFKVEVDNE